jgi:hypothetical protein
MALQSMTALASITLQSESASVVFSGIPQNYRDLILVLDGLATGTGGVGIEIEFNDFSLNATTVWMRGHSGGTQSATDINQFASLADTQRSSAILQIMDYSATDKHKAYLSRANYLGSEAWAYVGRWGSTTAITTIRIRDTNSRILASSSTFNLYGRIA